MRKPEAQKVTDQLLPIVESGQLDLFWGEQLELFKPQLTRLPCNVSQDLPTHR